MSFTTTATTLITDSLTDIGVLGVGRSLNSRDSTLALRYLQEFIDTTAGKLGAIYNVARTSFTWTANQQSRTIGPTGADLTLDPRPLWLVSATRVAVGETDEIPLDIWHRKRWLYEVDKAAEDDVPLAINLEPGPTNSTINAWPKPTSAFTLILGTPTALSGFANLTTSYTFPEGGYREWFRKELCVRLARPFGKAHLLGGPDGLKQEAKDAFNQVERVTDQGPPEMAPNILGGNGYWDVYTGQFITRGNG